MTAKINKIFLKWFNRDPSSVYWLQANQGSAL